MNQVDYTLYYASALQGLRAGWHHLYDLEIQRAIHRSILPDLWWFPNVYTPALSLLLVPFTLFPLQQGFWLWEWLLCASFGLSAFGLAPGNTLTRAAHLALAIVPYPVALGLGMGQVLALQMGALAVSVLLLERGRETAAGAVLTVVALKPQGMLLVPFALLAAGKRRAFASWLSCSAALSPDAAVSCRLADAARGPRRRGAARALLRLAPPLHPRRIVPVGTVGVALRMRLAGGARDRAAADARAPRGAGAGQSLSSSREITSRCTSLVPSYKVLARTSR